jgi:CheY-like chemotaxis protein
MHGPEAAKCMRSKGFAGIIVGVTGNVLQKDVAEYIQAGADHIMPKPITTAEVVEMLQTMIVRLDNNKNEGGEVKRDDDC